MVLNSAIQISRLPSAGPARNSQPHGIQYPENTKARRAAGLFELYYWLNYSRLGVTHLLSTGALKSRVVVGDFEFSTVLGA